MPSRTKEFKKRQKERAEKAKLPPEPNHRFWLDGTYALLLAFTVYQSFWASHPGLFIIVLVGLTALALLWAILLIVNALFYKHFVSTHVVIRVCFWSLLTAIVSRITYNYLPLNGYELLMDVSGLTCLIWCLLFIRKPKSDNDPLGIRWKRFES